MARCYTFGIFFGGLVKNKWFVAAIRWISVSVLTVILAGCLVPEKFDAAVVLRADGAYSYKYDGTAVNVFAAAELKQKGSLPPGEEAKLKQGAEKEAAKPGVKKFGYLGSGKFDVSLERDVVPGKQRGLLELVSVSKDKDGVFTVISGEIKDQDRKKLEQLGIVPNGTISVSLPPGAIVLFHNASSAPGVFGKAYRWDMSSFAQRPTIKYRLAN